ncbi:hypothetical protein ES703_74247 [subsurface metagenome]
MLIGLISDTHIDSPRKQLPLQIKDVFRGVDLILHAGDIWIPSVLDELECIAPVLAAWGDDDEKANLDGDKRMMKGHALLFEGVNLWLIHTIHIKPHYGLLNPKEDLYSASPVDPEELPDVIVLGHTHSATIEHYKDVLLVNPGSPTFPNYIPRLGTVALLTVDCGKADARLVQLE